MAAACREARVVVTCDLDFAALLATRQADRPSVVILRVGNVSADDMIRVALDAVTAAAEALRDGAIAIADGRQVRVRRLPI